jgi:hypothetical protein
MILQPLRPQIFAPTDLCLSKHTLGIFVSLVAPRYMLHADQIFNELKVQRYQLDGIEIEELALLPVEISTTNTSLSHYSFLIFG